MAKVFKCFPAVAAALLLLAACTPPQPYLPEPSSVPFGQGRLWQVDGPGIETSYVFATLRANDERLYRIPDSVDRAMQGTDLAAYDMASDPLSLPIYSVDRLKLPEGESLEAVVGARTFGSLTWHMKRSELRPKDNIRPWVFWLLMGGPNWGFVDYENLYDHLGHLLFNTWMVDEARRVPVKVVGLLNDREAFDLYNQMPLDLQAAILKVALDDYTHSQPNVAKVQLYLKGDLASLVALWREYLGRMPPDAARALDDWLIVRPNALMVDRVIPLMREDSVLLSADVLRLPGEQGILRLLERRGFTVTRLL